MLTFLASSRRRRRGEDAGYAPASRFAVSAAVLADDGRVFAGCKVENASFGLTTCAERAAVCAAVGARVLRAVVPLHAQSGAFGASLWGGAPLAVQSLAAWWSRNA